VACTQAEVQVGAPVFFPPPGTYGPTQAIALVAEPRQAAIRYAIAGGAHAQEEVEYQGPFVLPEGRHEVAAYAEWAGRRSALVQATYVIRAGAVDPPDGVDAAAELSDGDVGVDAEAEAEADGAEPGPAPHPWDALVIYQVMVGTYRSGDEALGFGVGYGSGHMKGDLRGIIEALDYIADLGVNALWLTPIFATGGDGRLDATGYFAQDYFAVDPHFGTLADARELVDAAHARGLYVFFDGVFGHHRDGEVAASPGGHRPQGGHDPVDYGQAETLAFYKEVATWWIEALGIDGWRLDQAYQVPVWAWGEIVAAVEAAAAARAAAGEPWGTLGYMVGEVWRDEAQIKALCFGGEALVALGSCFDFPLRYRLVRVLATQERIDEPEPSGRPAMELAEGLAGRESYPPGARPNLMLGNHDLVRFGDLIQRAGYPGPEDESYWARHRAAFSFMVQVSGPLTLYYGEEIGAEVPGFVYHRDLGLNDDHAARDAGRIDGFSPQEQALRDYVQSLLALRAAHPALYAGERELLLADATRLVQVKRWGAERILYVLNTGSEPATYTLDAAAHGVVALREALTGARLSIGANGEIAVSVPGLSGGFWVME